MDKLLLYGRQIVQNPYGVLSKYNFLPTYTKFDADSELDPANKIWIEFCRAIRGNDVDAFITDLLQRAYFREISQSYAALFEAILFSFGYRQVLISTSLPVELTDNAIENYLAAEKLSGRIEVILKIREYYCKICDWDRDFQYCVKSVVAPQIEDGTNEDNNKFAASVLSNALFCLNYYNYPIEQFKKASLGLNMIHPLRPPVDFHISGEKINVGYLSADLNGHQVSRLMFWAFRCYDTARFNVKIYNCNPHNANVCPEFSDINVEHVGLMSNESIAEKMRNDNIDILVELGGYTASSRPFVVQHRPAPVTISYLGYPNTIGLHGLHYKITDEVLNPTDEEFIEKPLRLPLGIHCYHHDGRFYLNKTTSNMVRYCSFNNPRKYSREYLQCIAEILKGNPNSILILRYMNFNDAYVTRKVRERFFEYGIPIERVDIGYVDSVEDMIQLYNSCDLVLDPYPYGSHSTACEALWMDTPILTLKGNTYRSRVGASLLYQLGMPELVCDHTLEYVQKAINFKPYPKKYIFNKMESADFNDPAKFCKQFEDAYIETLRNIPDYERKVVMADGIMPNNTWRNPPETVHQNALHYTTTFHGLKLEFFNDNYTAPKPEIAEVTPIQHIEFSNNTYNVQEQILHQVRGFSEFSDDSAKSQLPYLIAQLGSLGWYDELVDILIMYNETFAKTPDYSLPLNLCLYFKFYQAGYELASQVLMNGKWDGENAAKTMIGHIAHLVGDTERFLALYPKQTQPALSVLYSVNEPDINPKILLDNVDIFPTKGKVGILSGNFKNHAIAVALRWLSEMSEIILFSNTDFDETYNKNTKVILPRDPKSAALLIAEHEIDILVEIDGYTGGNLVNICDYQPARKIVSFLGYPGEMHHPAYSGRISDFLLPNDEFSKIWVMGCGVQFMDPIDMKIENLGKDYVCLNSPCKMSDEFLRVLREILNRSGRKIIFSHIYLRDNFINEKFFERLETHKIGRSQVEIVRADTQEEYLNLYNRAIAALDPWPYGGHSTTLEALHMGTPVVTLKGSLYRSNIASACLKRIGHPEWIAVSPQDYIDIACGIVADKLEVRAATRGSDMANRKAFAREFRRVCDEIAKS